FGCVELMAHGIHDSSPSSSIMPGYIAASGSFDPYWTHSKQKVQPSGSTCCAGPPHDSHSRSRSAAQRAAYCSYRITTPHPCLSRRRGGRGLSYAPHAASILPRPQLSTLSRRCDTLPTPSPPPPTS